MHGRVASSGGIYNGRHFTTYVESVKKLKRDNRSREATVLLAHLCAAAEEWAAAEGLDTPQWYHWQLAMEYRKLKDYTSEIATIERFLVHRHHPSAGVEFRNRLCRAQELQRRLLCGITD